MRIRAQQQVGQPVSKKQIGLKRESCRKKKERNEQQVVVNPGMQRGRSRLEKRFEGFLKKSIQHIGSSFLEKKYRKGKREQNEGQIGRQKVIVTSIITQGGGCGVHPPWRGYV